jgi:hypothetical protein
VADREEAEMSFRHEVDAKDAGRILGWFDTRGGIAVWKSINLSNPGMTATTPRLDENGQPTTKPSWQLANEPEMVITDPNEVGTYQLEEVKRFRIAIRRSSNGLSMKVTDGSTRKIDKYLRIWRNKGRQVS